MISAQKEKLNSFFQGSMRYVVPFFQRPYVWDTENWDNLWESILETYNLYQQNKNKEHFIGTLIIKQIPAKKINESNFDLIDGQQRITSISLLLKAIELSINIDSEFPELKSQLQNLLTFKDARGNLHHRIEHNRIDKPYFEDIISIEINGDNNGFDIEEYISNKSENLLVNAFQYFLKRTKDFTDEELSELKDVILHKVPVISMLLAHDDDEQEIFDTINSLGVKLTTSELLKNYIFKEKELQPLYDKYWFDVFEADEEISEFWNTDKTSGRVYRTNAEILLYIFLIIETQKDIRLEKLFKEYKIWLKSKNLSEKEEFLVNLKEYAGIYFNFPSNSEINEISFLEYEKRFFHIIENLSITTVYPLIMFIYKNIKDKNEREKILSLLESYLVRRNISKFTTKNYNNLFLSILQKLIKKEDNISYLDYLKQVIAEFDEITNKFPDNSDLEYAFNNSILSNQNAREILFIISLKQINTGYNDRDKLSLKSYSTEHIMPKKWEENWKNKEFTDEEKWQRNFKLKTLGNLTITTGKLNSKLKNASWSNKKEILKKFSSLPITISYIDIQEWNEIEIEKRADNLYKLSKEIWKEI